MNLKVHYKSGIRNISFDTPQNLLQLLTDNGIQVSAPCGGGGKCGKCKVRLLSSAYRATCDARGEILSCRHTVKGDLEIEVYAQSGEGLTHFEHAAYVADNSLKGYSAALDVGTTTLAAYLIDCQNGKVVQALSSLNPQFAFGADVISRIEYCAQKGTQRLQNEILSAAQGFLKQFETTVKSKINALYVAGNTAMLHIFAGINPAPLGVVPFAPVFTDTKMFQGAELNLDCERVVLLPSASAYIGGDITAGVVATDMPDTEDTSLLLDFGTNGEMVLRSQGKWYSASTAAGPAFEGANISCGLGGVEGAITKVQRTLSGGLEFSVLGGGAPKGICGSGLVDLAAILSEEQVIDESGYLCAGETALFKRVSDKGFHIYGDLYLTQKDIREIQLAKSAVYSGIEILLQSAGITPERVDTVYIAGGFGFYLNIENAAKLKILPRAFVSKARQVGNTSGNGAVRCALSADALKKCEQTAKKIENVDLATNPDFMDKFVDNMSF